MKTSDILIDAIGDMENKCEYLRTSISHMQNLDGISVDASTALCDSYLHICDAVRKAQDALVAQILFDTSTKRNEHETK